MRITAVWITSLAFLCAHASGEGIKGDVHYLGIALDQEGAAGGWAQVGPAAAWKATLAGAMLREKLYTVESSGNLYVTDLATGNWKQIGNADFRDTRFMVSAGEALFTIEADGTLYRVNPADGSWKRVGAAGERKETIAAVSLAGKLYTVERGGALYVSDLDTGRATAIGKADFAHTRFLFAAESSLYTIETDGTLYDVSPRDGSWSRVGAKGDWKAAINGAMLGGQLYTAESDGRLFCADVRTGERRGVGKADFAATRFMFPSGPELYTIEASGNLYRVEAHFGRVIDAFDWCTDEIERLWQSQGKSLSHGFHGRKIVGAAATKDAILDGLARLRQDAKPGDLVVIYLTAHGGTDPKKGWSIATADAQTLTGRDVKSALAAIPCPVLALIETCGCGGFAEAHEGDPPVPANVAALCACRANEVTSNPLDIAVAEALYGRADFNHDGSIDVGELIQYVERRYKEWWPVPGEGTNSPVIVRGKDMPASLSLTVPSKLLSAVVVKNDFYSALDLGKESDAVNVHLLGWSSETGKPYFLTNKVARDAACLETDGQPLLVERDGHWFPARRVGGEGNHLTLRTLGVHPEELTVGTERVRYPFAGGNR